MQIFKVIFYVVVVEIRKLIKMGKVRKPRPAKSKKPVPTIEEDHLESEVSFDSKENAVQTILDQLQVTY